MLTDGSTFTWEYFQPVQLVQQVLDKCSGIARLYAEKLRDNPPSPDKPWRIVLGCDEHTPGNKVVFKKGSGMVDDALGFVDITC